MRAFARQMLTGGALAGPVTSVLDNFTRADQTPLAGNWAGPLEASGSSTLVLTSNQVTGRSGLYCEGYWLTPAGADQEAFVTVPTTGDTVGLDLRVISPGTAKLSGYSVEFLASTFQVIRIDAGSYNNLGAAVAYTRAAGDKYWIRVVGSTITVGQKSSAGVWTVLATRTDSTYSGNGYMALEVNDNVVRVDDFGGGTLSGTAYYVRDTMTDTAATAFASHAAEVGGAVSVHPASGAGTGVITATGTLRPNTTSQAYVALYGTTPPSADQTVEWDVIPRSLLTSEASGPFVRLDPTALTGYQACYLQSSGAWAIRKALAGTFSLVGTPAGTTPTAGTTPVHCKLSVTTVSGNASLVLTVGGTAVVTATDSTSPITATGRIGARLFSAGTPSDTVGYQIDNLIAY